MSKVDPLNLLSRMEKDGAVFPPDAFPPIDETAPGLTTEQKIDEIHGWLEELMPAARVAMKMMAAKQRLMGAWRGGGK